MDRTTTDYERRLLSEPLHGLSFVSGHLGAIDFVSLTPEPQDRGDPIWRASSDLDIRHRFYFLDTRDLLANRGGRCSRVGK
jgi:hypothetical protein